MTPTVIRWLPTVAVAAHLIEEFVWPGGFGDWYRRYRPERAVSVTRGFLIRINIVFVVMALLAALLGFRPYGVAIWLIVASVGVANAAFHLWANWRMREYSPGVVTGLLGYIPLAIFGFSYFPRLHLAAPATVVQAALIGPIFNLWSAWNHRRRAARITNSGGQ